MNKIYPFLIALLFFSLEIADAHKCANNWCFRHNHWISFNTATGEPESLEGSRLHLFSPETYPHTISDTAGNLIFYTDGIEFYNSKHELFFCLNELSGDWSEETFVFPIPGKMKEYLFFYTHFMDTIYAKGRSYPLLCRIVDMNANGGSGSVCEPIDIPEINRCWNTSAVLHGDRKGVWLVCVTSRGLEAMLIDGSGKMHVPVISTLPDKDFRSWGHTKISPDGSKILFSLWKNNRILMSFDNMTGEAELILEIDFSFHANNYINLFSEFSENSKKIFVTFSLENWEQITNVYDLDKEDMDYILSSKKSFSHAGQQYQLGPDGKLYFLDFTTSDSLWKFGRIENPNDEVENLVFSKEIADVEEKHWHTPFPTFFHDYLYHLIIGRKKYCSGDTLVLESHVSPRRENPDYEWRGPNGFVSNEVNVNIPDATPELAGFYSLRVTSNDGRAELHDSVWIEVNSVPEITVEQGDSITICQGETATLSAPESFEGYRWTTGDTTRTIVVADSGTYGVFALTDNGCEAYAEIVASVADSLKPAIRTPNGTAEICENETIELGVAGEYSEYLWSTGDTTATILADATATRYKVWVKSSGGCSGTSEEFRLKIYPAPNARILGDEPFCEGGEATLRAVGGDSYVWLPGGSQTDTLIVREPGVYTLIAISTNGCSDTTSTEVETLPAPTVSIETPDGTTFCEGEGLTIRSLNEHDVYIWNDEPGGRELFVDSPGVYRLEIEGDNGCRGIDSVDIFEYEKPTIEIVGRNTIYENETLELSAEGDFERVEWSNGETDSKIIVDAPGEYVATAYGEGDCSASDTIDITHYDCLIQLNPAELEFDFINIGASRTKSVEIQNLMPINLEISNVYVESYPNVFKVVDFPAIVAANSSGSITIEYSPDRTGGIIDNLVVETGEICDATLSARLSGAGAGTVSFRLPDTTAKIGDQNYCFPIYAKSEIDLPEPIDIELEISLDASAIATYDSGQIVGDRRIFDISISGAIIDSDERVIAEVCGDVMVGNRDEIPLLFESATAGGSDVETNDGKIVLFGACAQDRRRIELFEAPELKIISKIGDGLSLEIDLGSSRSGALEIYNVRGELVQKFEVTGDGPIAFDPDLRDLPTGAYLIVLKTEFGVAVEITPVW